MALAISSGVPMRLVGMWASRKFALFSFVCAKWLNIRVSVGPGPTMLTRTPVPASPAAALHLIVGNTEEVLDHLRQQRVGLGLVEGHQRSPGVRLEQFMPDEIVPVCAPRIPDPKLRRAIEGLKSVRDLEALPVIWREFGAGRRA